MGKKSKAKQAMESGDWQSFFGGLTDGDEIKTEKLFVYGIFLDESSRNAYGMSNPYYSTVPGYITVGHGIVQAVPVENQEIALTGLVVDMDSSRWWPLDTLEGGYSRVKVQTDSGESCWMYVAPSR